MVHGRDDRGHPARRTGRGRAHWASALAAGLLLTGAGAALAADPVLSDMAGNWTGRGSALVELHGQPESIFCRIENVLSGDGNSLTQSGRCAAGNRSSNISGRFSAGGGGQYTATIQNALMAGPAQFSGRRSGSGVVLRGQYVDADTGKPVQAVIELRVGGGGYSLVTTATPEGGPRVQTTNLRFAKR